MSEFGFIFDMDGTLLDTVVDIAESSNYALKQKGYSGHKVDEYRYFVGNGVRKLIERALPEKARTEKIIDECLALFNTHYNENCMNRTEPYPGITEVFEYIDEEGIKTSILSNKSHDFTEKIAEYYFNTGLFTGILGASDRFKRKPDPDSALYLAEKMQIEPAKIVYVGDTATDMKTAKAAGMIAVGAEYGFRGRDELLSNGAEYLVSSPEELIMLFENISES